MSKAETTRTNDEEMPLSIGILGTSNIARKNILAIATSKNATSLIVGSRDEKRARDYAEETNVPQHGSYNQVLAHPNVDSVYIPLPTTTHLEWVLKAAKSGKHVLCEKPVAVNTSELIEMLRACRQANVAFMDGVMFMHHNRLEQLRAAFDGGALGPSGPRQINSQFSFHGDASFFANNIRCSAACDPLGCIGDLGWYNVRFSLFVFEYELPQTVRCSLNSSSKEGVPFQATGTMTWRSEKEETREGVPVAPRSSTFVCSFLHTECQNATIVGDEGFIELDDFVIPKDSELTTFSRVKHAWGAKAQKIQVVKKVEECPGDQTVAMWDRFHSIARKNSCPKDMEQRQFFAEVVLKTQMVVDALMESARSGGSEVEVGEMVVL